MHLPTCICEVCGVVARVVDGAGLGLIELLVFDFFELYHCGGFIWVRFEVRFGAGVYCCCGGRA